MKNKIKVGIVGCGAIGSGIARSIKSELKKDYKISGLYDTDKTVSSKLAKSLCETKSIKISLKSLIKSCDIVIEAVNSISVYDIAKESIKLKKNILVMSSGQLLNAKDLFSLAKRNGCKIIIPSGAISGIDAIKASSMINFKKITLTTRKPITGFKNDPNFTKKNAGKTNKDIVIFKGSVDKAVKLFPRNINVAATLSLACRDKSKVTVQIITSSKYKNNSHEIEMIGDSGRITTKTENVICPDNPKTSYLAVLSAIATLKQFSSGLFVGT
ncbi:MAG: DUF108 domain-containing protein [Candidatus Zapsychrus exili]|nr:DUF108 domain-containing protein [Candidatus Zapsychrus exili]